MNETIQPTNADIKSQITLHPENNTETSFISGNRGLVIAIAIGMVIVVIVITALFSLNSSKQYQGLIQNVQNQTKLLESKIEK